MEIYNLRYGETINVSEHYVVAIGNFDGIHQGHREVIKKARRLAQNKNLKLGVMCFDITPRQLVNSIDNYCVLRSFGQKKTILESLGVETIFLIHFNNNVKDLSADDFVNSMIIANNIDYLVCGYDFVFGKNKQGSIAVLEKYSAFKTIILPRFEFNHHKVSSTMINEMLVHGEIKQANQMLVEPYSIIGKVVKGNQKGRTIGFPTANVLPIANYRIPQAGVYATRVRIGEKLYLGMTNVGHNPTFNFSVRTSIETNVFDFDADLYEQEIEVIFEEYVRRESVFDNISDLIAQLELDKQQIITYFSEK